MNQRVLCDTNVLVSAFIAGGPPSRVIEQAIDRRIDLILAEPVLSELERVLAMKLRFEAQAVEELAAFLTDLATERVLAPESPEAVTVDPADDLILACAVAAGVQRLVSGDRRHLLPLGEHRGIPIVTPVALLAELAQRLG